MLRPISKRASWARSWPGRCRPPRRSASRCGPGGSRAQRRPSRRRGRACACASSRRRGRGSPRGRARRGFPCAPRRDTTVVIAFAMRFSSSSVSTRSEFQIIERSVTLRSASSPPVFADMRRRPSAAFPRCGRRRRPPAWCAASCRAARPSACRRGMAEPVEALHDLFATPPVVGGTAASRSTISPARMRRGAAEDDEIGQRIRAETVGAVDRGAAGFADGHQAGHDGVGVVGGRVQHLAPVVGRDAAHIVVGRWGGPGSAPCVTSTPAKIEAVRDAGQALVRAPRDRDGRGGGRCGPCSCRRRGPRGSRSSCSARRRRARRGPWPRARSAP